MQLEDHLKSLSVQDLRLMALRWGLPLSPTELGARATLVRSLTAHLGRYGIFVQCAVRINAAAYGVLMAVMRLNRRAGLTAIARELRVAPAQIQPVLEDLRLWGVAFPEGNWERIVVPYQHAAVELSHFTAQFRSLPESVSLTPPPFAPFSAACHPRPGSFAGDMAEFLARIARSRMVMTQTGRINRRDLKSIEAGLGAPPTHGYPWFVYCLAVTLSLLRATEERTLTIALDVDRLLQQPPAARAQRFAAGWRDCIGYPETGPLDPADGVDCPAYLATHRRYFLNLLAGLPEKTAVTVNSVRSRQWWNAPLMLTEYQVHSDLGVVVTRLLRSAWWLGLVALDDPEQPTGVAVTPLGSHVFRAEGASLPELVPDDDQFILQPNADAFGPPNLSPRTKFHLRRISGEKKGGGEGTYPLTRESLQRALEGGLGSADIITFLERFSRTGLPGPVRAMVETAGRQYGRVRLIPAEFILVTEDAVLMQELRAQKTVSSAFGQELTDRSVAVRGAVVTGLLRSLRAKGYAPQHLGETIPNPRLPSDPAEGTSPMEAQAGADLTVADRAQPAAPGQQGEGATDPPTTPRVPIEALRTVLHGALTAFKRVAIRFQSAADQPVRERQVLPIQVLPQQLVAADVDSLEIHHIPMACILDAQIVDTVSHSEARPH